MKLEPIRRPVTPSIHSRSSCSRWRSYFWASWGWGKHKDDGEDLGGRLCSLSLISFPLSSQLRQFCQCPRVGVGVP